jgi:hypothetical protein
MAETEFLRVAAVACVGGIAVALVVAFLTGRIASEGLLGTRGPAASRVQLLVVTLAAAGAVVWKSAGNGAALDVPAPFVLLVGASSLVHLGPDLVRSLAASRVLRSITKGNSNR